MKYQYWLANIDGIGNKTIAQLYKYCNSAKEIYELSINQLSHIHGLSPKMANQIFHSKQTWDLEGALDKLWERNIHFTAKGCKDYPKRLEHIFDAPYGLYWIGDLPEEETTTVGIVGARNCSAYGREMAIQLGEQLAKAGISVISGLAKGIDSYAHTGALQGRGKTFGVLGCGVDLVYPPENWRLYEQMAATGGIISEYAPGFPAKPGHFPSRNRIISGLSDAVIIIEAKEKSGSLITADFALEQGRDIFAIPGRVTDSLSEGCNRLIKQGAGLILSPKDFLEEMNFYAKNGIHNEGKIQVGLEKEELMVYSTLDLCPKSLEQIMRETGLLTVDVSMILMELMERGLVKEVTKNYFILS